MKFKYKNNISDSDSFQYMKFTLLLLHGSQRGSTDARTHPKCRESNVEARKHRPCNPIVHSQRLIGNYKILNHNKIFLSLSLVDQFIYVILKSEDHIKVKKVSSISSS